jgi:spermidine synthase
MSGSKATLTVVDDGWENHVEPTSGFWFEEDVTSDFQFKARLSSIEYQSKSEFQSIQIITTKQFGRTLVLDHKTQSAANDEHIYHESLVHPALMLHPNPQNVYIGGGGEMGTAREILRHKSVEKCVMVDIDRDVCELAWTHLKQWSAGVKDDPRFELFCEDAKAHLEQDTDTMYDVIVMDIADPIEAGPGIALYTRDFYKFAVSRLNPGGIIVTQSGPGSHFNVQTECCTTIARTLRSVFDHVYTYAVDIPSFGSNWAFNIATGVERITAASASEDVATNTSGTSTVPTDMQADLLQMLQERSISDIDSIVAERCVDGTTLKYYDGVTHMGVFGLTKEIRDSLKSETRIMTLENPVFMH